jgi:polar amino acid transport system substrate-binding protein
MRNKWGIRQLPVMLLCAAALSVLPGCTPTKQATTGSMAIPPDKNILRVGVTANSPPLIFKQANQIVGLEADFARELAKYLGRSLRFVELKWEDQIQALLDNRIDIIMSGMSVTPLRKMRLSFTTPYFKSTQMPLIRRKDATRFSTGLYSVEKIGVIRGTTGEEFVETEFSTVNIKTYSDPRKAAKALVEKEIDMFIYDAPMVLYLASEYETKGLTVLYTFLKEEDLAWGVRKGNDELLHSANEFLQKFNEEGNLNKIIKYWIPLAK